MTVTVHAKSPLRLGLAGGGTDVAPFSDIYGGFVLNATISLHTHCRIETLDNGTLHFVAADFKIEESLPLSEVLPLEGALVLHRAVYNRIVHDFNCGEPLSLQVTTYSDVPPGSGIGSSSSLVVAMVQAYVELLQLPLGEYDVAHLAYQIERIDCAMAGGKQDQYAATFGGFNFIEFSKNDRVVVNPLRMKSGFINEFEAHLLLYHTGRSRSSAAIIQSQIAASSNAQGEAVAALLALKQLALEMKEALLRGRISSVLDILGQSWFAKKKIVSGIANSYIDEVADAAMKAGARGLKISGAGGGGFMMIAADIPQRYNVIRALSSMGGHFFIFKFGDQGVQSWKIP